MLRDVFENIFVNKGPFTEWEIRFGLPKGNHYERSFNKKWFDLIIQSMQETCKVDSNVAEQEWTQFRDTWTKCGTRIRSVFDSEKCVIDIECCRKECAAKSLARHKRFACFVVSNEEHPSQLPSTVHADQMVRSSLSLRKTFLLNFPTISASLALDCTVSYQGVLISECTRKIDNDCAWDCSSLELEVVERGDMTFEFLETVVERLCDLFEKCGDF